MNSPSAMDTLVGHRALKGHASVLDVLVVTGFCVSCASCLAFLCSLVDVDSIQLFVFLRLDPKNGHGQLPTN